MLFIKFWYGYCKWYIKCGSCCLRQIHLLFSLIAHTKHSKTLKITVTQMNSHMNMRPTIKWGKIQPLLCIGFSGGSDGKESVGNAGDLGLIPWRREWLPTPVFLPGEFHGQRNLADYGPWSCKESDMTERLTQHVYVSLISQFVLPFPSPPHLHVLFSTSVSLKSNLNRAHRFFLSLACLPL